MNRLSSSAASHSFQARSSESHTHDPETSGGTAKNTPPHHDFFLEDSLSFASAGPPSGGQGSDVVFERRLGRRGQGSLSARHALFAPLHYEPGYSYPLLIWLHSQGGSEHELRKVMPHVSLRNYVAASVRGICGAESDNSTPKPRGYSWRQGVDEIADAAEQVRQCVDVARRHYNIHPQRIFLAGYESGGTMALRVGLAHPEWFAGAASLEGPMPRGYSPLGRVKAARRLPLLLASCRASEQYDALRVAADLRLLHAAGFSLALRQYPGDHELTTEMLADLDRWIMEQFCPASVAP